MRVSNKGPNAVWHVAGNINCGTLIESNGKAEVLQKVAKMAHGIGVRSATSVPAVGPVLLIIPLFSPASQALHKPKIPCK